MRLFGSCPGIGGAQYRHPLAIILTLGTPKKVSVIMETVFTGVHYNPSFTEDGDESHGLLSALQSPILHLARTAPSSKIDPTLVWA